MERLRYIMNAEPEETFEPDRTNQRDRVQQKGQTGQKHPSAAADTSMTIESAPRFAPMDRDIVFSNVHFRYTEASPEILCGVDLTIRAGTTVGILGATGAGKSTLVQLLDRLWDLPPENGSITVGGVDIREMDRGWLRSQIGMVLQEPYLFSRTLAENIAIAMPKGQRRSGDGGRSQAEQFPAKSGPAEQGQVDQGLSGWSPAGQDPAE